MQAAELGQVSEMLGAAAGELSIRIGQTPNSWTLANDKCQ